MLGLLNRLRGKVQEKPALAIEGPLPGDEKSGSRSYSCQHIGPAIYTLIVDGELYPVKKGRVCPECCKKELRETYTCCALCGRVIFRNKAITLYEDSPDLKYKSIAGKIVDLYVGCTREDCNPGRTSVGYWKSSLQEPTDASVVIRR